MEKEFLETPETPETPETSDLVNSILSISDIEVNFWKIIKIVKSQVWKMLITENNNNIIINLKNEILAINDSLGIWKIQEFTIDWRLIWEKWVARISITWKIMYNSWDLNIWRIRYFYSNWKVVWDNWEVVLTL